MLLSTKKNPPNRCGALLTTRDIICIYYDLKTNWSMFYVNGNIRGFKTIGDFQAEIQGIADEVTEKDKAGRGLRCIAFINDLDVVSAILPDGQESGAKKKKSDITYTLELVTDRIVFRNFNTVFNNRTQRIQQLYHGKPICEGMALFIQSLGLPLKYCRYSLAYVSKRIFYQDIKAELWEDTRAHSRILRDVQTYRDMQAGCQSGALSAFSGAQDIRFKVLHDVYSFDKKSAYPSYFVQDKFFPIGKIERIVGNVPYRLRVLRALLATSQWFKIVIESPEEVQEFRNFRDVSEADIFRYGVEFWDFHTLRDAGIDVLEILSRENLTFRLYGTKKTGYMPDCFRRKIVQLYEEKNRLPKNSPEKFLKKTQLDMIYGKGLQKYNFETDQEVFKKYVLRGENFLSPAMSMHVVAGMRHEMLKVSDLLGSEVIAIDTDGLKGCGDLERARQIIDDLNAFIIEKNRVAGFDTDCGIWDFEYYAEKFIQFAQKVYAYQVIDESPVCKFAGIAERHLKKYLQQIDGDPFKVWEREGLKAQTCGGWYYLPDIGFIEKKVDYIIKKENEK